jgi:uncharacterized protein YebE (UPF0316 family)
VHSFADISPAVNIWLLTPLLIFIARIVDVTIGTIRIISLSRGRRILAPILGFFEVLIWLFAIRQIFQNVDHIAAFVAYAAGFAAGNFVGMMIEEKLAFGHLAIRMITASDATPLVEELRRESFGVTTVAAQGQTGAVQLIFMVIARREYDRVMEIVRTRQPSTFISVSDVRSASEGVFPKAEYKTALRFPRRKGR